MSIRKPLRPLARVFRAREEGSDPNDIERANLKARNDSLKDGARLRAEGRLLMLCVAFVSSYAIVAIRMGQIATSPVAEPVAVASSTPILAQRADITDRDGRILATNRITHSLYAQPQEMIDPIHAANSLALIFPDLDAQKLLEAFTGTRTFFWIKKKIAPEQQQAVHDIGEPGLLFGPREERLYPNGRLAAHILGGTKFGREGVVSAEIIGQSGIEREHNEYLSDPTNGDSPLQLSIDLTVQSTVREVLDGGMRMLDAKGATAVMMDIHSGEIIAMSSLPDFDPNSRPEYFTGSDPSENPRFNRAVQGVYELGSTFKIFTAAQALELGLVNPQTKIPATPPFRWGKHEIGEFENKNFGPSLSVTDMIVKSSNVATAHLARDIGVDRHQDFLRSLGFFEPTTVELAEARATKPLLPPRWSELSTLTIAYGHGLSASPLHLATAYSSLLNGGTKVEPTLMRTDGTAIKGERIVSPEVSQMAREMLRDVVANPAGTASFAEVSGYFVAGKTGTADKPNPQGGYYEDKTITTFASVFPANDPQYVLVVTFDEPVEASGSKPRRTAGWTAVPVAGEIIRRTAPLMGMRPVIASEPRSAVTLTSSN